MLSGKCCGSSVRYNYEQLEVPAMPSDETEVRLRSLEKSTAVMEKSMEGIERALTEIKQQISSFLDKAQLALAIEGRVERLEEDQADTGRKVAAAFKLIDQHKAEFERVRAEHEACQGRRKTETSWLRERLSKLTDAALIGVVLWLLMMWKTH